MLKERKVKNSGLHLKKRFF